MSLGRMQLQRFSGIEILQRAQRCADPVAGDAATERIQAPAKVVKGLSELLLLSDRVGKPGLI